MSHRRPTLPSVTGSAFLILVAEGLLEALELTFFFIRAVAKLLSRAVFAGRSPSASLEGTLKPPMTGTRSACMLHSPCTVLLGVLLAWTVKLSLVKALVAAG